MPRRIRRSRGAPRPCQDPFPPALDLRRLAQIDEALRLLGSLLGPLPLTARERVQRRTRWRRQTPRGAAALSQLLEKAPDLLGALPYTAEELRERAARALRLEEMRSVLGRLHEQVADLLLIERSELFDRVQLGVRAVEGLLESPLTPAGAQGRLQAEAGGLLGDLEAQREAMRQRRRRTRALGEGAPRLPAPEARPPGAAGG